MKNILLFSLVLILFSCSDKENSSSNLGEIDLEGAIENAESRRKSDPNASGGNKCLLTYQTKYDQLISENDVISATGFSKDVMESKYNKTLKNPEYHEFVYRFKNKRIGKVRGFDKEMELPDMVVVRFIKSMSLTDFERSYQSVTDEQMQAANEALSEISEGNSGNADADKAMQQAESQNISKEEIKKTGGILTDAFKEVSKGYRVIEGLGDAARWNLVTNELFVLQNGVKFEIRTDLSNDPEKNKSVAIDLAKIILDKCN